MRALEASKSRQCSPLWLKRHQDISNWQLWCPWSKHLTCYITVAIHEYCKALPNKTMSSHVMSSDWLKLTLVSLPKWGDLWCWAVMLPSPNSARVGIVQKEAIPVQALCMWCPMYKMWHWHCGTNMVLTRFLWSMVWWCQVDPAEAFAFHDTLLLVIWLPAFHVGGLSHICHQHTCVPILALPSEVPWLSSWYGTLTNCHNATTHQAIVWHICHHFIQLGFIILHYTMYCWQTCQCIFENRWNDQLGWKIYLKYLHATHQWNTLFTTFSKTRSLQTITHLALILSLKWFDNNLLARPLVQMSSSEQRTLGYKWKVLQSYFNRQHCSAAQ